MPDGVITVVLADDNLIVRTGVRALLARESDVEVVGEAADHPELLAAAAEHQPQVVVTDIRMPPSFQREGIDAAKEIRQRNPGTGVVILSQYDDPEYAVSLLADGAAGYSYLLKDRLAEGDQLIEATARMASGGTLLDPVIVDALVRPVQTGDDQLNAADQELLTFIAEGKPIKAIAVARQTTPEAVSDAVEHLFLVLAKGASSGDDSALRRLRMLHQMIVDREEQGETLSRLLPGGVAEKLRLEGKHIGETEELEVTVLMSDIRSYSSIAERTSPTNLAAQLNEHRAVMNRAILDEGGTVMQFVGDAVMAVFGAPVPQADHADRAMATAMSMHRVQAELNGQWAGSEREEFVLGIGLSTGEVAAALLGSEERLEYTLVGDTVNLSQRLQDMARPGWATVVSDATWQALTHRPDATSMGELPIKGREGTVSAWRVEAR
ncbi:MAG: adenylate/guanylate cyclase domain-containing protein [Acidimicrobiales bacterium]